MDLAEATRFRQEFGLRSDEAWIRFVAIDPLSGAGMVKYGIPLTPDEVADLDRRSIAAEGLKRIVIDYGLEHPDEYAGAWIDQKRGGVLVAQFSANSEQHKRTLLARVNPNALFEVRQVSWSLNELRDMESRIAESTEWLETIPAALVSLGVDEAANRVLIRISSANPSAAAAIEDHYGWTDAVIVETDGTGALLLPRGTLLVLTLDGEGRPVSDLRCVAIPDLEGAYEAGLNVPTTDATGRCRLDLPATGYWIRINQTSGARETVAYERAVVVAGRTTEVVIRLNGV